MLQLKWIRKSCVSLTVLVGCMFALSACQGGKGDQDAAKDEAKKERPPLIIPVEASNPKRGNISTFFETSTRVEAERRVQVASKGSARCVELLAEEGDEVSKGDVLAKLDPAEVKTTYDQTSVQVRQDKTTYTVSKKQYEEGLGTKVDMENAQYAYEQSLETLKAQKLQLENLTIRAPIDGVITTRTIREGTLVSAGDTVFDIMDPESFMLPIALPEKEMSRLAIGQEAEVRVDAFPGQVYKATVRRINPSVDAVSGTIKVVLDFEDSLRGKLRDSAFARVKLVMNTQSDALLVPKEVLVEENGKKYAFVLSPDGDHTVALKPKASTPSTSDASTVSAEAEDGEESEQRAQVYVAKRVEVMTALEDSDRVQVVIGLSDKDLMVTNGQHSLKDGAQVRVTNMESELALSQAMSNDELLKAAQKSRKEDESKEKGKHESVKH